MNNLSQKDMEQIYRRYYGDGYKTAYALLQDETAADRVTNAAIEQAAKYLPVRSEYLFRKKLRKRIVKRCKELLLHADEPVPSEAMKAETVSRMQQSIAADAATICKRKNRRIVLLSFLLAAVAAAIVLCAVFIRPPQTNKLSFPPYTEQTEFRLGETFSGLDENGAPIAATFTKVSVADRLSANDKLKSGYYIIFDCVLFCDEYSFRSGFGENNVAVAVRNEGETDSFIWYVPLNFSENATVNLSCTEIPGQARGVARFVYYLEQEEYDYLRSRKDTSVGNENSFDISILLYAQNLKTSVNFKFFAHEIDFGLLP